MKIKPLLLPMLIFILGTAVAQDAIYITKSVRGGEYGLIPNSYVYGFSRGDRFKVIRNTGAKTIQVGEVEIIKCEGKGCAIKLVSSRGGSTLQAGDELVLGAAQTPAPASDWEFHFGLAIRAGTLGYGGELGLGFHPKLGARVGYHTFGYKYEDENADDGYKYAADLNLRNMYYLVDYYPWAGTFRLTAGLFNNKNAIDLTITPTDTYTYGGRTYAADEIGILTGLIDFKKNVPYIGLGWGNPVKGGVGFCMDIGVVFQDSPLVDLSATGMLAPTAEQDNVIAESLEGWKAYGVVSFGIKFRIY